ncbi:MAG: hypothetical protein OSP8Acid_14710 [uncultured Acidilobus sp. OSP8]|nr:MAG: hypothetical protein OSP8Acid_14710 [uncultured Acidilobus sp. OSP8]
MTSLLLQDEVAPLVRRFSTRFGL